MDHQKTGSARAAVSIAYVKSVDTDGIGTGVSEAKIYRVVPHPHFESPALQPETFVACNILGQSDSKDLYLQPVQGENLRTVKEWLEQERDFENPRAGGEAELNQKAKVMMEALSRFRRSYYDILEAWDEDVLKVSSRIPQDAFPFDRSFDEVDIPGWVEAVTEQLQLMLLKEREIPEN